ncbi:MAG: ribonuclease III [Chloroflexi bacterium]|nr:ribonuclease III [Chloroflexota bacterium]
MTAGEQSLKAVQDALSVRFQDESLLGLAFVHSSFINETAGDAVESNERLEFLGDGVVNLIVAQELYVQHPDWSEGQLTSARSALVRTESLAQVAGELGLGAFLLMGKGEDGSGGRERLSNLAAVFEAVTGALFLDQGYATAQRFVLDAIEFEPVRAVAEGSSKNPKSALQELVQSKGLGPPKYRIVESVGPDHEPLFTAEVLIRDEVKGSGIGSKKSLAQQRAAEEALEAFDKS